MSSQVTFPSCISHQALMVCHRAALYPQQSLLVICSLRSVLRAGWWCILIAHTGGDFLEGGKQDSEIISRHCQGEVHSRISSSLPWSLPVKRWPLETLWGWATHTILSWSYNTPRSYSSFAAVSDTMVCKVHCQEEHLCRKRADIGN